MQYTQDALFPDSEVVGTGQPAPWPSNGGTAAEAHAAPKPFKIEWLAVQLPAEEPQP